MSSLAIRKAVVMALAGTTIASGVGATPVSARPVEQFVPGSGIGSTSSTRVPPPPSSIAASAGEAYEDLRAPDQPANQPTGESQPVVDEPTAPSGFDLASAAIGAVTGAGLVIVLLAAGRLARRRPLTRRHDAIGA